MLTTILFWQITSAAGDIVTPEKIMFVLQAAWCGSTKGSGTRRTPNFTLTKGLRATCSPSCAKKKKKKMVRRQSRRRSPFFRAEPILKPIIEPRRLPRCALSSWLTTSNQQWYCLRLPTCLRSRKATDFAPLVGCSLYFVPLILRVT